MNEKVVLKESDVLRWLACLMGGGPVIAPVRRGRNSCAFDRAERPEEVRLDYVRTVLPPKSALLPPRERLLEFQLAPEPQVAPVLDRAPWVLFGVHPCDLAAINQLDWAMQRRHDRSDPHYAARREAATIIGIECLPDEYCFCTSVGTCDTREGADLFLTPVAGGYLAEVLTDKGAEAMRAAPDARTPSAAEGAEAGAWSGKKAGAITSRLAAEADELPDLLEGRHESALWEETAERCYGCGTCTNVCPTCFCFDVWDEADFSLAAGARSRRYDSCQFLDFALVAGPHNFRPDRPDRVRHRWFRKFVYLNREYGSPFCVGCGRCSQACTANIGLVEVLNAAVDEARKEAV